jgi:hypothetical protein
MCVLSASCPLPLGPTAPARIGPCARRSTLYRGLREPARLEYLFRCVVLGGRLDFRMDVEKVAAFSLLRFLFFAQHADTRARTEGPCAVLASRGCLHATRAAKEDRRACWEPQQVLLWLPWTERTRSRGFWGGSSHHHPAQRRLLPFRVSVLLFSSVGAQQPAVFRGPWMWSFISPAIPIIFALLFLATFSFHMITAFRYMRRVRLLLVVLFIVL